MGTGFGKRVPEMSLINSLRGRESTGGIGGGGGNLRRREKDRGRGCVRNDRETAVAKRKMRKKRRR